MLDWRTWHRAAVLSGALAFLAWLLLTPAELPDEAILVPTILMMVCGTIGGLLRLWHRDY